MTAKQSKPDPPDSLDDAGEKLWRDVVAKYELRVDELAVLEAACRTADMIATLDKEWTGLGKPFLTRGSMGQDVIHPLIGERRQQQAQLAALLGKLKLPDDVTPGAGAGVNPARAAAESRWKHGS
ncbi:hypothetical protein [Nocardioides sp. BYT-33-1]|uniref:hypothetical protein n=1 Tax=Nocardioides sp. BYT-33-1 TaxID=3416952 RepID=UPI003F52D172